MLLDVMLIGCISLGIIKCQTTVVVYLPWWLYLLTLFIAVCPYSSAISIRSFSRHTAFQSIPNARLSKPAANVAPAIFLSFYLSTLTATQVLWQLCCIDDCISSCKAKPLLANVPEIHFDGVNAPSYRNNKSSRRELNWIDITLCFNGLCILGN